MSDNASEFIFYVHDGDCSEKNYGPLVDGLKTCLDCASIFDKDGKGVPVMSARFDGRTEEV